MALLNVGRVIDNPKFTQQFLVTRSTGSWGTDGRFAKTSTEFLMTGIVQPQTTRQMMQQPGGDTIQGTINIYTRAELHTTQLAEKAWQESMVSDEITWQGENYKIIQVNNFSDYGYYQTTAVRKFGA